MLGSPQEAFGLSQMADSLLCTEGDILRALKYWENEKLVSLIYEGNALTGITLLTPRNKADEISVNAEQDFPVQENPLSNLENAAAVSSQDVSIANIKVSFVGRNLLMFYNKAPFDPMSTASMGNDMRGIDYFRLPSLRNMGFSLRLTF